MGHELDTWVFTNAVEYPGEHVQLGWRVFLFNLWDTKDPLLGIQFNENGQISLLKKFDFQDELALVPIDRKEEFLEFYHRNHSFENADAELLYNMVRHYKPGQVIELGSGYSTRMMNLALDRNKT